MPAYSSSPPTDPWLPDLRRERHPATEKDCFFTSRLNEKFSSGASLGSGISGGDFSASQFHTSPIPMPPSFLLPPSSSSSCESDFLPFTFCSLQLLTTGGRRRRRPRMGGTEGGGWGWGEWKMLRGGGGEERLLSPFYRRRRGKGAESSEPRFSSELPL